MRIRGSGDCAIFTPQVPSLLCSLDADLLSVTHGRTAGEGDQLLPTLESLRDLDLALHVAARSHRCELRAAVEEPEHAGPAIQTHQRGTGHEDTRSRRAPRRRLRRE